MKIKDERTKSGNELFSSLKFIKINAFEDFFVTRLLKLREKEKISLRKRYIISCISILSYWISPGLILNSTFGLYIALGHNMTPANTFAVISIFSTL